MATNYPGSLDDNTSLPNPGANSFTNAPSHAGQHDTENDAIKALEAKVGIGASTPPGSGFILASTSTGQSSWQAAPSAGVWGAIAGTLSNQTDLQTALNAKLNLSGGTMTGLLVLSADPTANLGAATKQYVDAAGTSTAVRSEIPGGSINGSNVNYTTASTYATGSLKVYLNGQRLLVGSGNDYVEVTQGFTMQYAPVTGDILLVDYDVTNIRFIQGSNSYIVQETPSGTVNGVTTLFTTLQGKYVANTLEVYTNGLQQTKTTDYVETSPGSGTFTFTTAPLIGDAVRVGYQFATGSSGNADTVDGIHASATATANTLFALDSNATLPQTVLQTTSLGYAQIISTFTTSSTTAVQVTGLTTSVTIPTLPTGRRIKITVFARDAYVTSTGIGAMVTIWDGTVGSGTQLAATKADAPSQALPVVCMAYVTPAAGSKTYNVGFQIASGSFTGNLEAGATFPAFIAVDIV